MATEASLANDISTVLGWESKWMKITNSSISSYIDRAKKHQMKELTDNKKKQAADEMSVKLKSKLSWKNKGNEFTKTMSSTCKPNTLDNIISVKYGTLPSSLNRNQVISDYRACMKEGLTKIIPTFTKEIVAFKPDADAIIKKYKGKSL